MKMMLPSFEVVSRLRRSLDLALLPPEVCDHLCTLFGLVYPSLSSAEALAENPVTHHLSVLEDVLKIAQAHPRDPRKPGSEPISLKLAAAAALLHDIAPVGKISKRQLKEAEARCKRETDEMKKGEAGAQLILLEALQKNYRTLHMLKGKVLAQEWLFGLNQILGRSAFSEAEIQQIVDLIAMHDNPSLDLPIPRANWLAVCFREGDRLWMLTDTGLLADLIRERILPPNANPEDRSVKRLLKKRAAENAERHKDERKIYANEDGFFGKTFYRTKTGYDLFSARCKVWKMQR